MENKLSSMDCKFETVAWGLLLIWWGLTDADFGLVPSLPAGAGWIGIGLILLGLNAARAPNRIPASGFTITLGIFALTLGALRLTRSVLGLPPIEISLFPILLVALGTFVLIRELMRFRRAEFGS
ncbi:MAG: hypothetical protein HZB19_06295 [Chloroflexi bacterium]|nr:hypothetical protein [Chloroflexota bacterium]